MRKSEDLIKRLQRFTPFWRSKGRKKKNLDLLYNMDPDPLLPFGVLETEWDHFVLKKNQGSFELLTDRLRVPFLDFLNERVGGFHGKSVLELGPLEGFHTCALDRMGAAEITAIEGNPRNFLKCLIVQNHYQLKTSRFLLGDFTKYLQRTERRFDFILAAGVLYHLVQPIWFLQQATEKTDAIGICTTLYDPEKTVFKMTGKIREVIIDDHPPFVLHERLNPSRTMNAKFGLESTAWMISKSDLLRYLEVQNFECQIFTPENPTSEATRIQLFARRKSP